MKRRRAGGRDQTASAFAASLGRLCDGLPALCAALVDAEGETVDYSGCRSPFDIRVMAAELRLVLGLCGADTAFNRHGASEVTIRAERRSYFALQLTDGYALVVELPRRAFRVSRRALAEGVHELCHEAQMRIPASFAQENWMRVDVREERRGFARPTQLWLDHHWLAIDVLGLYRAADMAPRDLGYRVRLETGFEVTLVRENFGRWYADHLPTQKRPSFGP